jgi:hypothetical protein
MSIISSASGSTLISSGALDSNYSGSVAYGPKQVSDGLVLYVDAANPLSYPGSGDIWYDLTKNGYSGALSGSSSVVPSWDSTDQGRIHIKASSSYQPGNSGGADSLTGSMSSSFINFGKILDNVFVGTGSQAGLNSSGGGTISTGTSPQFTLNMWFEIDYSKQIVQSAFSTGVSRNWYPNFGGNLCILVSKYADNSIVEETGYQLNQLGENRHFYLGLFTSQSSFNTTTGTPLPNPITNPYTFYFTLSENPQSLGGGTKRSINIRNTSSLYYVQDNTPTNICVVFDSSEPVNNRIKLYVNGFQTTTGDSITTSNGPLTGNYSGSNSALALGAWVGATDRVLEGSINGPSYAQARGTAYQSDSYYHMFQVYNKALTPQEVEQNYWAHKYRFRPWETL